MKSNWQYLALALALAVFTWHLVSGREKVDTWIQMPVEMVNAPQGYVVRQGMVNRIEVQVRGPRPMVRGIDMKNAIYPLNLTGLRPGVNVLEFEPGNIPLSRAIEIVEIVPPRVELVVDKLMTKEVPVEADYHVQLHEDFQLKQMVLKPEFVTIRGPQILVEPIETIKTQPVEVDEDHHHMWEAATGLVLPAEVEASPARVVLQLLFGEKMQEKWVEAEVRLPELEGRSVRAKPAKVRLLLLMPVSMARAKQLEGVSAVPDDMGALEPGTHLLGYRVTIPAGSSLVQTEPEAIEVRIAEE
ncbi:MAG TPA: YbbR-like domain-containing protein [Desulfonatronum sp.]|nr:YbbR-like domain-containing protein [Desulfonatronum sp.]